MTVGDYVRWLHKIGSLKSLAKKLLRNATPPKNLHLDAAAWNKLKKTLVLFQLVLSREEWEMLLVGNHNVVANTSAIVDQRLRETTAYFKGKNKVDKQRTAKIIGVANSLDADQWRSLYYWGQSWFNQAHWQEAFEVGSRALQGKPRDRYEYDSLYLAVQAYFHGPTNKQGLEVARLVASAVLATPGDEELDVDAIQTSAHNCIDAMSLAAKAKSKNMFDNEQIEAWVEHCSRFEAPADADFIFSKAEKNDKIHEDIRAAISKEDQGRQEVSSNDKD